tara:strand:- start:2083 stop:2415 length:333 start_codon:yes stop_codon:yes gene_type:complete
MALSLVLFVGNTKPFDVVIGTSLDGADRASFTMRESTSGTIVLQRDTVTGNMTIDKPNMKVISTLTGTEADGLATGQWVAQAGVRFGDDDSWQFTELFHVQVREAVVVKV